MTVSQNVFKGFSLFGKWQSLSSRCWLHHQTDLNLFLKLPIHLFPIYDPQLGFHITWWNCPNCSKSLVNRHQPVMATSQPLNAKSLSLHSPPVHQLSVCLSATSLLSPTDTRPLVDRFLRGNRCFVGDAMSTSRRRGTDWRRWRRLWRAHRTDKRRILGLSFVFHRDHHHQMIRWSDDVSDDDEEDDDEEDDDVDQNVDAAAAAVSRFFKFWSVWSWSLRRDNDGVRWENKPACLSIC